MLLKGRDATNQHWHPWHCPLSGLSPRWDTADTRGSPPAQQWHSRRVPVALLPLGGRGSPASPPGPGSLQGLLLLVLLGDPGRNKTQQVTKQGQPFPAPRVGIPLENTTLAQLSTPNPAPPAEMGKCILETAKARWSREGRMGSAQNELPGCHSPQNPSGAGSSGSHPQPLKSWVKHIGTTEGAAEAPQARELVPGLLWLPNLPWLRPDLGSPAGAAAVGSH